MQKCSICEKPIYGHPETKGKIVCGSCPLMKMQGGASGKSLFEVRLDLAKMVTKQVPANQESVMRDLKVKSNVKNRTILLDGRYPLVFDASGLGKCPEHLRHLLEREMVMKPGRFSFLEEEAPVVEVAPVVEEVPAAVVAPSEPAKVEEVPAPKEEVSPGIDLSFLAEEPQKPVKQKASKK